MTWSRDSQVHAAASSRNTQIRTMFDMEWSTGWNARCAGLQVTWLFDIFLAASNYLRTTILWIQFENPIGAKYMGMFRIIWIAMFETAKPQLRKLRRRCASWSRWEMVETVRNRCDALALKILPLRTPDIKSCITASYRDTNTLTVPQALPQLWVLGHFMMTTIDVTAPTNSGKGSDPKPKPRPQPIDTGMRDILRVMHQQAHWLEVGYGQ
jgi:hypothetical protein